MSFLNNSKNELSADERHKVYEICKTQMGGVWDHNNEEKIIIERFAQGVLNKLYYCKIPDIVDQYNQVVVRLTADLTEFGDTKFFCPLASMMNSLILSEKKIAPKVYRVFSEGLISQFIESRLFDCKDENNPKAVSLLGKKLAKLHSLHMPIIKDNSKEWLRKLTDEWFNKMIKQPFTDGKLREQIISLKKDSFVKQDIAEELEWIKDLILSKKFPIMFTHCDFNRGNILVHDEGHDFDIFFIDFDFSQYNFRGYDMGAYFSNWGFKGDLFESGHFPTDEQMLNFIDIYIEESNKLSVNYSKNLVNSRDYILKEAKLFSLFSLLKDILYCLFSAHFATDDSITERFLTIGDTRFHWYNTLKNRFLKENHLS